MECVTDPNEVSAVCVRGLQYVSVLLLLDGLTFKHDGLLIISIMWISVNTSGMLLNILSY